MSVSVIIPVHDRWSLLPRALHSVRQQTSPPEEVLVVDDGSRDDRRAEFERLFPEVCFLRQEHRGVSAARNRGIERTRSSHLAFLDSDDEWHPEKLAEQLAALERQPRYRICHTNERWVRHGRFVNPKAKHRKRGGRIYRDCLPLCVISPSAVMIHRSIFQEVGSFDESLPVCEDYDLWLRICSRHEVLYLDRPLLTKYGGHEDQLSARFWGMDRFRVRALQKILASGHLPAADFEATVQELRRKLGILIAGAEKRGRDTAAHRECLQRWSASREPLV